MLPRQSYLASEPKPARALALLESAVDDFPRVVLLSLHPPALPGLPASRRVELALTESSAPGEAARPVPLGQIGGRLREAMAAGVLVYTDALDFLLSEASTEMMVQFTTFLTEEARSTGSAIVASIDAATLDLKQFARIARTFSVTA